MRERHDRDWWHATVARWRNSGQTAEHFGAVHDVHPATLRWWSSRLRWHESEPDAPLALVRVEVAPATAEPPTLTALVGPAELQITVGTDADYVAAVVAAIARAVGRC